MPGFDGTGPKGEGPMTGRGEGHCAIRLPSGGTRAFGYAGLQGSPVLGDWPPRSPIRAGQPVWPTRALGGRPGGRGHRGHRR